MIGEGMDQPISCLDGRRSPREARDFMSARHIRYIAVAEDHHIAGILSDLLTLSGNREPKAAPFSLLIRLTLF